MNIVDFSYGDNKLSDYGCMIASINTSFSEDIDLGSNLTFKTLQNKATKKHKILKADYDNCVSITFDICKNQCVANSEEFTDGEISYFMRWLNSKTYQKFKPIYEDEFYSDIYFYGTFDKISAINIGKKTVGLTLSFISNSPFGYIDEKEFTVTTSQNDEHFVFYDDSDEIGFLYPNFFEITCDEPGDFKLSNTLDSKSTVIHNCEKNEVITMDCENKVIQSSKSHLTLYNDFNYNFPRIVNTLEERKNVFTVSIPCTIRIKYSPIRKAGVLS